MTRLVLGQWNSAWSCALLASIQCHADITPVHFWLQHISSYPGNSEVSAMFLRLCQYILQALEALLESCALQIFVLGLCWKWHFTAAERCYDGCNLRNLTDLSLIIIKKKKLEILADFGRRACSLEGVFLSNWPLNIKVVKIEGSEHKECKEQIKEAGNNYFGGIRKENHRDRLINWISQIHFGK